MIRQSILIAGALACAVLEHRTRKWTHFRGRSDAHFLWRAHRSARKTGSTFPHDALALSPVLALGSILLVASAGASIAAEAATVSIPYGELATEAAHIGSAVLTPLVLLLLAKLTGPVGVFLRAVLGERLIRNAVDYGVNAVEGATKGKTLSVKVGSAVFAEAVHYAVSEGAPWLVKSLGGPDGIRRKVFRALDLEAEADAALVRPPASLAAIRKAA